MFRKILLWFAGMLLLSFLGYMATSYWLSQRRVPRGTIFRSTIGYQFTQAIRAYETGGPSALEEELLRMRQFFPGRHFLLDESGRNLVTGEDYSALLKEVPSKRPPPFKRSDRPMLRRISSDGRYNFVVEFEPRPEPLADLALYGWIVVVIVLLTYVLALTLVRPVRQLHDVVVRFGQGDLSSRVRSRRKDELGELARAFDRMADRIETLLTAERRLLQDVSHELRSPLARLRFALELSRSNPDSEAALARVDKEVDRLSTLVGELLHVTRAEGDPAARNLSAVDLAGLLQSLVDDCRIEAQAHGCEIQLNAPESLPWTGDGELLHRAAENVLRNAISHSPARTAVRVDLVEDSGQIVVRIRDYGPGVPEDQLSQIFHPFYRVEQDRNRTRGGVGLGLSIAERAVVAHHGEIEARNANPGLLVEIRLPK